MTDSNKPAISVLMVCLGNICRSPTAQGVLERMLEDEGLADRVAVDSAGTGDYHVGELPDPRAREAAAKRGYQLDNQRARQVPAADFQRFDYILAMDEMNRMNLEALHGPRSKARLHMLLEFADSDENEVPDPYYGGGRGFDRVLDLVEEACRGLVDEIRGRLDDR